jgi:RNA-directed DNA polymerase
VRLLYNYALNWQGESRTALVYVDEKSDKVIQPMKRRNKGGDTPADAVEGRILVKVNSVETTAGRTQGRATASSGLDAVPEAAGKDKEKRFTALLHHITVEALSESNYALKREAEAGDGRCNVAGLWRGTGGEVARAPRLRTLRASPARRITIPTPDGTERPLSIWCLEDKIVQHAVVRVLEAIYETDFLGFSYGFRPGRGQHDALDALTVGLGRRKVNWVLDADIRRFFDAMNHDWILEFLKHRIRDKRILRLIRKWLKVGIVEDRKRTPPEWGTSRSGDIANPGQHLPALCIRPVGERMAG